MKILVIDDDKSLRYTLARILVNDGYEVVTAEDGEHGQRPRHVDFFIGGKAAKLLVLSTFRECATLILIEMVDAHLPRTHFNKGFHKMDGPGPVQCRQATDLGRGEGHGYRTAKRKITPALSCGSGLG